MASTIYYQTIQQLYVAYFNRPADVPGLQYWEAVVEAANGDTTAVSAAFAASNEYKAAYAGMDAYHVVGAVYQNLFGHDADPAGLNFWASNLIAGNFSVDQAVTAIAAGALGSDKVTYDNRVTVAMAFTAALDTTPEILAYTGDGPNALAKQFVGSITDNVSLAYALDPAHLDQVVHDVLTPPAPPVPVFALSSAATSIDEGGQVTFMLNTNHVAAGTVLSYQITGVDAARINGATSGSVTVDSNGQAFVTVKTIANLHTDGLSDLMISLANGKASASVALNDTSLTPAPIVPTYVLTSSAASVDEGGQIAFTLTTTNVAAGTILNYSLTGVDSARINGATAGQVTVDSTGHAVIVVKTIANAHTDGLSDITLNLANGTATAVVTLNDTSLTPLPTTPTYAIVPDVSNVNEGGQVTFQLNTTNVAPGTTLSYTLTGVDAARINGATSGTVMVDSNGQAVVIVKTVANAHTDGLATMHLQLLNGAASADVVLNDTSLTPVVPTSFTVDAGQIVAANNTLASPVIVTVGETGAATVTVASTTALHSNHGIVIQGDADTTINLGTNNTAGSTEAVYVTGTGNTTVNFGHQSTDSVFLNNGNDTIAVTSLTMVAGQTIDGGDGTDTLAVTGTNDFTAGTLTSIEQVVMHSSAKFTTTQVAGFDAITEEVGGVGTLEIAFDGHVDADNSIDITGKLTGIKTLIVDTGVEITLSAADLAGMTNVLTTKPLIGGHGTIVTTVAGAQALLALNANVYYSIDDTAANLAAAPAAVFAGAHIVNVGQGGTGSLTIDQAVTVHAGNANATYTVSGTAAELYNAMVFDDFVVALTAPNATVVVTSAATIQQAEVLSGLNATYSISDTAAHIATAYWDEQNIGAFIDTVTSLNVVGPATASQAVAIEQYVHADTTLVNSLTVTDSLNSVLDNLNSTAMAIVSTVMLSSHDEPGLVAQIVSLKALVGAKLSGGYSVKDSATHLLSAPAIANGATDITVNDEAIPVSLATQIETFSNGGSTHFNLVDTPANLLAASPAVLADALSIHVTGDIVNVAQANAIAAFAVDSYTLTDTAAAILGASATVIAKALADGHHLVTTDAGITVVAAKGIYALDDSAQYVVADSAANLAAAVAVANFATSAEKAALMASGDGSITATTAATVAQAVAINAAIGTMSSYDISDTVANVVAGVGAHAADITAATNVAATGPATLDQLATLTTIGGFDGEFVIADTAENVAAYLAGGADAIAVLNDSNAPVTLSGNVTVAAATALKAAATFTNWNGSYDVVDTYDNLFAAAGATLTGAHSVVVQDTIDNVNTNYAWISAHAPAGYQIADTITNLIAGGNSLIVSLAKGVTVTVGDDGSTITAAHATTLYAANHAASYVVKDIAVELALGGAGVAHATTLTVSDVATVAQINAIKAVNATATISYNLTGTAAQLAAGGATVTGAGSVVVTGDATAAQVATIVGLKAGASVSSIVDTLANIQAAASATIDAAAAGMVSITNGDRVILSAAEITAFTEASGVVAHFQATAAGLPTMAVTYNLRDTMANLVALNGAHAGYLVDAGKVMSVAGGVTQLVADVAAVRAANPGFSGSFAVKGTVASLLANASTVTAATGVTATDLATAAQSHTLFGLNGAAVFGVSDTAAALMLAANSDGVSHAATVVITDATSVANVKAVMALNSHTTFSLTDTAANLAAAGGTLVHDAVGTFTITGTATVAQMHTIDAARGSNIVHAVTDTAANIAHASQTELNEVTSLTITGKASAADAVLLDHMTYNDGDVAISFAVSDTAANIVANLSAGSMHHVTGYTVTTAATAAQAVSLQALFAMTGSMYEVADTAANLLNVDTASGWNGTDGWMFAMDHASKVTVTDNVDIATAEHLAQANHHGVNLVFNVVDTEARIVEALAQTSDEGAAGIDLNWALGQAAHITVTGVGAIALTSVGGDYVVTGTVAQINAMPADLKAHGYVVNDSVANVLNNFSLAAAGKSGVYSITDTGAHIAAAASSLVGSADNVTVTDVINAATAATIYGMNSDSSYDVTDTVANLNAGGFSITNATHVIATGAAATAVQAQTLIGLNSSAVYNVTGSAADLITYAIGSDGAASIAITGATTSVAQLVTIKGYGPVSGYSLTDTAANLAAATTANVSGATAVVASSAATGTEAAAIFAAKPTAVFAINESTVTKLFTGDVLTASTLAATSITTGAIHLDVAQAAAMVALGVKFVGSFDIVDSVANVAAAPQLLLTKAIGVTLSGAANVAQAMALDALTFGASATDFAYNVKDTAAAILAADAHAISSAAQVEVTDVVSMADADALAGMSSHLVLDHLSDTSTNLQLGVAAEVNAAVAINVTDAQSVAQAAFLMANIGNTVVHPTYTFANITDTAADVLADTITAGKAASITLTGTASVTEAEALLSSSLYAKLSGGYSVADSADSIVTAFYDQDHQNAITGAAHITLSGSATAAQAQLIEGFANVAAKTVDIVDTLAHVNAVTIGTLNLANSITATLDVNAGARQVFTDTGLSTSSTLVFGHNSLGVADTVMVNTVPANDVFTLTGADILTLKVGDTVDLGAFGLTTAVVYADNHAPVANGEYMLVRGNVSNGGLTFTASGTGTSTMVLFDADAGTGFEQGAIVLVGQTSNVAVDALVPATHVNLITTVV